MHVPLPVPLPTRRYLVAGRMLELTEMSAGQEDKLCRALLHLQNAVVGKSHLVGVDIDWVDWLQWRILGLLLASQVSEEWIREHVLEQWYLADDLVRKQLELNRAGAPLDEKAAPTTRLPEDDWSAWEDVCCAVAAYFGGMTPQQVWDTLPRRHIVRYSLKARRDKAAGELLHMRLAGWDGKDPSFMTDEGLAKGSRVAVSRKSGVPGVDVPLQSSGHDFRVHESKDDRGRVTRVTS